MKSIFLYCLITAILLTLLSSEVATAALTNNDPEDARMATLIRVKYPFFVSIFTCNSQTNKCSRLCAGCIVTETTVLTSCHCALEKYQGILVASDPMNIGVVAGESEWKQVRWARAVYTHPSCRRQYVLVEHDVAIITLQVKFNVNKIVQPIRFYSQTVGTAMMELYRLTFTQTPCVVLTDGLTPNTLEVTLVAPIPTSLCAKIFCHRGYGNLCRRDFQIFGEICVTPLKNDPNGMPCQSKGGGALICNGYIFGIASLSPECNVNTPLVFAHVEPVLFMVSRHVDARQTKNDCTIRSSSTCGILTLIIVLVVSNIRSIPKSY